MAHLNHSKVVLFDASAIADSAKTGVGYYAYGLIKHLSEVFPHIIFVGYYHDFLGRNKANDLPQAENIRYKRNVIVPRRVLSLLRLVGIELPFELLIRKKGDFIIFPAFLSMPTMFDIPMTTVVHDLAYLDLPETVASTNRKLLTRYVPRSMDRSSFITTISHKTARRIKSNYELGSKKVVVTHIPPNVSQVPRGVNQLAVLRKFGIVNRYILFVGTLEPRKNIVNIIKSYTKLSSQIRKNYTLVLAGKSGWDGGEMAECITQAKNRGVNIIVTGYITDEEKAILYKNAGVFYFPTLYEGFGMPPLEAMYYGTPVLVSNIGVLNEVCSDAALYCDPGSSDDMARKLSELLQDKILRSSLSKKGVERVKVFTWNRTLQNFAKQLKIYLD